MPSPLDLETQRAAIKAVVDGIIAQEDEENIERVRKWAQDQGYFVGFCAPVDEITQEMREIMKDNSRALEEMVRARKEAHDS